MSPANLGVARVPGPLIFLRRDKEIQRVRARALIHPPRPSCPALADDLVQRDQSGVHPSRNVEDRRYRAAGEGSQPGNDDPCDIPSETPRTPASGVFSPRPALPMGREPRGQNRAFCGVCECAMQRGEMELQAWPKMFFYCRGKCLDKAPARGFAYFGMQ